MSAYPLLTLSIILILGRQGCAKLLDEGCRPRYIPLISGGGEYNNPTPHMAYLRVNGVVKCGASLISNRFVLTAKHCLNFKGDYSVVLGKYDKSTPEKEEKVPVAYFNPHPDKNIDIALLELKDKVENKPTIKPICIIVDTAVESQLNSIPEFMILGSVQDSRQQVLVERTDLSSCGNRKDEYSICVKNPDQFSCEGDTGSPLAGYFKYNGETVLAQVGVLAGGSNPVCNTYSDVVKITPWIVSTINKEKEESIWRKIINYIWSLFE
ncbi:complement factor D-like [Drosophila kikkawai]|uniref:Complement factor D-like n=1 Tax=Drosophila kikkawai TaxID=30033 RepID=A0A6P4IPG7_DROKI|nr:serine protease ami-like [Drosophila kikkawai]